ncbi:efflux RND transporter periplasmic adaptor subunit [Phycisphaeraceae bacterium AH-315-B13]|nr:efflux RND transporter periplasmic adaptor subunit [Phycisphaeraceae bacterium AH-315-B13]
MHPAVRLADPDAKCPICFMDLIPVPDDAAGDDNARRIVLRDAIGDGSAIETVEVARFFPTATVRLYGKISYDETFVARLSAYFPSRIDRLFVNYRGVPVNKGDHLAEVYSPELLAAFEELRQSSTAANATGDRSQLVRQMTRDILDASRDKLRLFGMTDDQIAAVEDGSFNSDRLTIYAPIGGVVTHLAVREGDYVQIGNPIATVADLTRLWLDLEVYESQLPMIRWGQQVSFTVESHPGEVFAGQVSFIEPMIDDRTRTAAVRVAVDNTDRRLKPGMFASAIIRPKVGASGAVVGDELVGRWISPMHPSVVKDEPGECDICGMDLLPAEALGIISNPEQETPLVVPHTAVLFTGTRSVVYIEVANEDKTIYEGREVVLGSRAGDFYIVKSGLEEGDMVVVHGAFRIDSAMQISAKPSMMSPKGGPSGSVHAGHGGMQQANEMSNDIPESFIQSLSPIYETYLAAQEALANDDFQTFTEANTKLIEAVGLVKETGLSSDSVSGWREASVLLRPAPWATNIVQARANFEQMSEGIIQLQRHFGHVGDEPLSIAFCPMALDNKGADWLQRGEQVNNPYFGASMLRCGSVLETFQPMGEMNSDEHKDHNND